MHLPVRALPGSPAGRACVRRRPSLPPRRALPAAANDESTSSGPAVRERVETAGVRGDDGKEEP